MRHARGFTLLELLVVVLVVAILAALAYPSYIEQIRKGKRSEAIRAIAEIQLKQEAWRSNNTTYGNLTGATAAAGNIMGTVAAVTAYNTALSYYTITVSGNTASAYTVTATRKGDMANDPTCGNFTMAYSAGSSSPNVTSGDKDYCWRKK